MDTAKRVAPVDVYCFGLQNLRRHMCCRAIKNKWYRGRNTFTSVHTRWIILYANLFVKIVLLFD